LRNNKLADKELIIYIIKLRIFKLDIKTSHEITVCHLLWVKRH
jgi:hypothetical protein